MEDSDDADEDANQAAMIAAMAGFEQGEHGPMTEQEIADMRMAQELQQRYVQRAQRDSRQQRNTREN